MITAFNLTRQQHPATCATEVSGNYDSLGTASTIQDLPSPSSRCRQLRVSQTMAAAALMQIRSPQIAHARVLAHSSSGGRAPLTALLAVTVRRARPRPPSRGPQCVWAQQHGFGDEEIRYIPGDTWMP